MKVKRRDGVIVEFNKERILNKFIELTNDNELSKDLTAKVIDKLNDPNKQDILNSIKVVLEENASQYLTNYEKYYQDKEKEIQERKEMLDGIIDDSDFDMNQLRIAAAKYLKRDENGKIVENINDLYWRVAKQLAASENDYELWSQKFYNIISKLEFLPGGRTLSNAGHGCNQLANCFVIPINDSMEKIFDAVKAQALVQKTGGGTGFDFSELRSKGSRVIRSNGVASGPVTFIKVFDAATSVIMQGNRRGANMGILRVDHPDILEFITSKDDTTQLTNFNLSVSVTDNFMEAVKKDEHYDLIDPHTKKPINSMRAKKVFDMIIDHAWKTGEPGIIFIDNINKTNWVRHLGDIAATNPCGEVPLLPWEACNLGSINLSLMVKEGQVDWDRLKEITRISQRLLDNVIDVGTYPIQEITEMVKKTRRTGLGIFGFADMLYQLNIPYNSDEGVEMAEKVMKFINDNAHEVSRELAEEKGVFPAWPGSDWEKKGIKMRNCAVTSIAPTGTLSMLASTSGGCEPNFALCFIKNSPSLGETFVYANQCFEKIAKEKGFYSEELMRKIAEHGSVAHIEDVPKEIRDVYVTAHEITPEWHIKMQAAFQKYVDNSISKTINFPNNATKEDVKQGYLLAYDLGCKGCTVYRDGSRGSQVLNIKEVNEDKDESEEICVNESMGINESLGVNESISESNSESNIMEDASIQAAMASNPKINPQMANPKNMTHCPECGTKMTKQEGCVLCLSCGFSACSL